MYKAITSSARESKTDATAHFTQPACDTDYLRRQATAYHVKLPVSSPDFPIVAEKLVDGLRTSIEAFDVTASAKDAGLRQAIEQQVDATLLFLSCVTPPS